MAENQGQFKKGQRANPHGRAGKPKPEPVYDEEPRPEPPLAEGDLLPSEVLSDLRWAYRNFGVRCLGNPQQMAFRDMMAEDRVKFMELLTKHEQLHGARVKEAAARRPATEPVAAVAAPAKKDEGLARAVAMCDRWLADYADRQRKAKEGQG